MIFARKTQIDDVLQWNVVTFLNLSKMMSRELTYYVVSKQYHVDLFLELYSGHVNTENRKHKNAGCVHTTQSSKYA